MDWTDYAGLSERWQSLCRGHASAVVRRLQQGDHRADPSDLDDRAALAPKVLQVVRLANAHNERAALRERFAPAYFPFAKGQQASGPVVGPAFMLDDGRMAVVAGSPWEQPRTWVVTLESMEPLLGVHAIGRSPNRAVFALARSDGVHLSEGWGSRPKTVLPWPQAYGPTHPEVPVPRLQGRPFVVSMLPFDDAQRLVLVTLSGVFLLTPQGSRLIHPGPRDLGAYIAENGDDAFPLDLASVHAALSPDQAHLAVGDRASLHRILTASGEMLAAMKPAAGRPRLAAFSGDGREVVLASTSDGTSKTVRAPVRLFQEQLRWQASQVGETERWDAQVSAVMAWTDGYLYGGSDGFIRLRTGDHRADYFVGGAITAFDRAPAGEQLLVCTDAGTVHLLDLAPEVPDSCAIGTHPHREVRRWLFWRDEPQPLIW